MKPRVPIAQPVRLSRHRERWAYAIGFGTWVTGVAWLVFHFFVRQRTAFGDLPHPMEAWSIKAHAAFALAAVWTGGMVWAAHVQPSWSQRARRASGIALVAVLGVLIVSAYGLLYLGDEDWRRIVSLVHWIVGLALPLWGIGHVVSQRRRRNRAAAARL